MAIILILKIQNVKNAQQIVQIAITVKHVCKMVALKIMFLIQNKNVGAVTFRLYSHMVINVFLTAQFVIGKIPNFVNVLSALQTVFHVHQIQCAKAALMDINIFLLCNNVYAKLDSLNLIVRIYNAYNNAP